MRGRNRVQQCPAGQLVSWNSEQVTYIDKGLAHEFRVASRQLQSQIRHEGDSLDTVKCGKEDHLGITIFAHSLDVFPQLLQDLLSVLYISLSTVTTRCNIPWRYPLR
jgi:hypothetical protein